MKLINAVARFFYGLLGYSRVAAKHYRTGYDNGYGSGANDGFEDAVNSVEDWHEVEVWSP